MLILKNYMVKNASQVEDLWQIKTTYSTNMKALRLYWNTGIVGRHGKTRLDFRRIGVGDKGLASEDEESVRPYCIYDTLVHAQVGERRAIGHTKIFDP